MKSCLEKNDIEMYSTYNEGQSVAGETVTRTLKKYIHYEYINIKKICELLN